jgi:hypothetical protein
MVPKERNSVTARFGPESRHYHLCLDRKRALSLPAVCLVLVCPTPRPHIIDIR